MRGAAGRIHQERALLAALAVSALLFQTSCAVLPVKVAPGSSGVVVDADTGVPIADALVVVRYDGRHGDVLPDREVLGHREVRSDARGQFSVDSLVRAGLSVWPVYKTEVRVVAVFKDGYRCARPAANRRGGPIRVRMHAALDADDQRASCSPVPANPGEADEYLGAWRGLFPDTDPLAEPDSERQLVRVVETRSALGYGENCQGPVFDLALAPNGQRASYVVAPDVPEVRIVEFSAAGPRRSDFVVRDESWPPRRLAWTSTGDLVLWEPSADTQRSVSPSIFGSDRFEVVWRAPNRRVAPPAAPSFQATRVKTSSAVQHSPLDPADLNDEGDARWSGRSFSVKRTIDAKTGLASESLHMVRADGSANAIALPGESCGPLGRFGRPHYRITADGRSGIDLRFIDGGCHAIAIDFESGAWTRLDATSDIAVCNESRSVPASAFNAALQSYAREVEKIRVSAGADPVASYALVIAKDGSTRIETRNHMGEAITAAAPDFPIETPLRRIDVSLLGSVYAPLGSTPAVPEARGLEPL